MNENYNEFYQRKKLPKGLCRKMWTDYPFVNYLNGALVTVLNYDGNKYCDVQLPDGTFADVKRGYLHRTIKDLNVWRKRMLGDYYRRTKQRMYL